MKVQRFDHTAIAVRDLRAATDLFCGLFGAEMIHGGDDPRLHIRTIQLQFPEGSKVELLYALDGDSGVAKFIEKRGEGLHHVTFFVDDVAGAEQALNAAGYETVDTHLEDPQWRETYLRPKSGFGALIQLADSTEENWTEPTTEYTLEDVLDGKVVWADGSTAKVRDDAPATGKGDQSS
jgi:methylmalonyl-CoA/ethylmalonyl-CoA epimerase